MCRVVGRAISGAVADRVVRRRPCILCVWGSDRRRLDVGAWLYRDGDLFGRSLGDGQSRRTLTLRKGKTREGEHAEEGLHFADRCRVGKLGSVKLIWRYHRS